MSTEISNIDLDTLTYYKIEIDNKFSNFETFYNDKLDLKIEKNTEGSPSGVATLDMSGQIPFNQIYFANVTEAQDVVNITDVVNPYTLHTVLDGYYTKAEADSIFGGTKINTRDIDTSNNKFAYLDGGKVSATLTQNVSADINNYTRFGSDLMTLDAEAGTIKVPTVGYCKCSVSITLVYDTIKNIEEDLDIIIAGTYHDEIVVPIKLSRKSSGMSFSFTKTLEANADEVFNLELRCMSNTLTGVSTSLAGFEIEYKHIK
jgi:hypothetical protein